MIKYLIIPFLLCSSLFAYPRCSQDLAPALRTIYRFPEGRKLIEEVEKEGPVEIYRAPFNSGSHAMWVEPDRAVVINSRGPRSFGEVVRSVFFELHNAKSTRKFTELDWLATNRRLTKSEYVKAVEWTEHQNAYTCACLIEKAIREGYFPQEAYWPISADFEAHYQIQQRTGHSSRIAAEYDSLTKHHNITYR